MSESPWLTEKQQEVWRLWLEVTSLLPAALHRQLQGATGLSLQDFDVLVQLTESAEGRLRLSDLARALNWDRSRASHHVKRMGGRGLVTRQECPDDGRGAFVVVTPSGRAAIELAAPSHARTVRELMFDSIDDAELDALRAMTRTMLDRLQGRS